MRALKVIGTVVAVVAIVATAGAALAPAAAAGSALAGTAAGAGGFLGLSAATLSSIGLYAGLAAAGIGMASSLLFKPTFSNQGNPLNFQTNPQSGLPYAIGRTRMSGLRIHADTANGFEYNEGKEDVLGFAVLLSAGGPIEAVETFRADKETITFNPTTGAAPGDWTRWMAQKVSLGALGASALAMTYGGIPFPGWTADHKLSGMAHALWTLGFDAKGNKYGAGVPEPEWIGKWVKVYDPRLDSTYPGGSGSHRALDEATYEWSRNPALHALTWALGRWQNDRKVLGIGAPVANIRVADFVEAANVADANEWFCGGVEWSTDSKWAILKKMLQAGGAEPTMTGAMIGCRVNTPRVSVATVTGGELLDSLSISTTRSRRDRFNTVIPRYRSEDHEWEVVSGTPVTVPTYVTEDGGQRTKEIDFPLVQYEVGQDFDGNAQAGQLAAYEIVNSREGGPIRFTTGPKFVGVKTGDVVTLDVPDEGLDAQPVLIRSRSIDPATFKITFEAETETTAKHDFALGKTTVPPPTFSPTPPDLTPPTPSASLWSLTEGATADGVPAIIVEGACEYPGADSVLIDYRKVGDADWTAQGKFDAGSPIRHFISPVDGAVDYEARIAYQSSERVGPWLVLSEVTTPGFEVSALIASLTPENIILPADADGNIVSYDGAGGTFQALLGAGDVSADFTLSIISNPQSLAVTLDGQSFTITGGFDAAETIANLVLRATGSGDYAGVTFDRSTRLTKSKEAPTSVPTLSMTLTAPTLSPIGYAEGTVADYSGLSGRVRVFRGNLEVTNSATLSKVDSSGVSSSLNTADNSPNPGEPKGYYRLTGINQATDRGSITITATFDGQTITQVVAVTKYKGGYEIVSTLPATNLIEGRLVYLTTNNRLYRYDGSAWTAAVEGALIQDGTLTTAKFASGIEPVTVVTGSVVPTTKSTNTIFLTGTGKLYRWTGSAYTVAIPTSDLSGQITSTQITDSAITTPKLATNSVTADAIAAGAVTASELAANSVIAGKVAAGAITATEIAAGAIATQHLAVGLRGATTQDIYFEADPSTNPDRVTWTAGVIFYHDDNGNLIIQPTSAGSASMTSGYIYIAFQKQAYSSSPRSLNAVSGSNVNFNNKNLYIPLAVYEGGTRLTVHTGGTIINGGQITTGSILADRIQAGSITSAQLASSNLITNSAQIGNGVINSANIGNLEVTSAKIANLTVGTEKIVGNSVNEMAIATLGVNKTLSNAAPDQNIVSINYNKKYADSVMVIDFVGSIYSSNDIRGHVTLTDFIVNSKAWYNRIIGDNTTYMIMPLVFRVAYSGVPTGVRTWGALWSNGEGRNDTIIAQSGASITVTEVKR